MVLSAPTYRNVVETFTYDAAGPKLTQTDGDGRVTRYAYDLAGRVIQTTQPLVTTVKAVYDPLGPKTAETDQNGFAVTWAVDYFGLTTSHVDLGGATVTYSYDQARQLVRQISTRGQSLATPTTRPGSWCASTTSRWSRPPRSPTNLQATTWPSAPCSPVLCIRTTTWATTRWGGWVSGSGLAFCLMTCGMSDCLEPTRLSVSTATARRPSPPRAPSTSRARRPRPTTSTEICLVMAIIVVVAVITQQWYLAAEKAEAMT